MVERFKKIALWACLFSLPSPSQSADRLTLRDGSVYSSLVVAGYDGERGRFEVEKEGRRLSVRSRDVQSVEIEGGRGGLTLREGSRYSDLDILFFDVEGSRLRVGRSGKILDLPLHEIASVRVRGSEEEAFLEFEAEPVAGEDPAPQAVRGESEKGESEAWSDTGLFSNLPEDFGRKQVVGPGGQDPASVYTPRWKSEAAGKSTSRTPAAAGSAEAPKPVRAVRAGTARGATPPPQPDAVPQEGAPSDQGEVPETPLEGGPIEGAGGRIESETDFGTVQGNP